VSTPVTGVDGRAADAETEDRGALDPGRDRGHSDDRSRAGRAAFRVARRRQESREDDQQPDVQEKGTAHRTGPRAVSKRPHEGHCEGRSREVGAERHEQGHETTGVTVGGGDADLHEVPGHRRDEHAAQSDEGQAVEPAGDRRERARITARTLPRLPSGAASGGIGRR
jgi:hypothetical protein